MKNIPTAEITMDDIHVAEYNPRIMPQEEMSKLERSISTFGLVDPIIVDLKHNNTIIGGHQRYEALKTLGTTTLTLIPLGDIGLVITNDKLKIKDENDQKALNLTLNKITGEWDYKKLENNLIELVEDNYQIELTGFEVDEIELDTSFDDIENELDGGPSEWDEQRNQVYEEYNDKSNKTRFRFEYKKGDEIKLGSHTLIVGDLTQPNNKNFTVNFSDELILTSSNEQKELFIARNSNLYERGRKERRKFYNGNKTVKGHTI